MKTTEIDKGGASVKLRTGLRRFRAGEKGAVAIIFGLALIPLLTATGVGVDYLRAQQAKTALQAAVDSAALAASADATINDATLQQIAQNYIDVNSAALGVKITSTASAVNTTAKTVTFEATATVDTTFLRVANIEFINIGASATIRRRQAGPVDMAIVLDQTNSMTEILSGSTTKIAALKTAANALVDTVMASPDARVGLVPFTSFVNGGSGYGSEPWLVKAPDRNTCTYSPACSEPCIVDGAPSTCVNASLPGCVVTCSNSSWNGCITHRPLGYRDTIADPIAVPYPGAIALCASLFLPLSSSKSTVKTRINNLSTVNQKTFIPMGLVWGWNMLTADAPLTQARTKTDMTAVGGSFALVLVSDGASTVYPHPTIPGSYLDYTSGTTVANGQDPITLTQNLCNNIKSDRIVVFTVRVKVTDPATNNLLINCATQPANSYDVQNTVDLNNAFSDIGAQLQELRVVN